VLKQDERDEILKIAARYEQKGAADIEALKLVQEHYGWVSDEHIRDIAEILGLTPDEVDNVATFYSLIFREPVGRHVIHVCDSISCWLMGETEISARFRQLLGIDFGQTTNDGRFTLLPIACLGVCDHAPALMIDRDTYTDLTPEMLENILERYT